MNAPNTQPVDPASLVGTAWMEDPEKRAEFERLLAEYDILMKPLTDALDESMRLTAEDLDLVIHL